MGFSLHDFNCTETPNRVVCRFEGLRELLVLVVFVRACSCSCSGVGSCATCTEYMYDTWDCIRQVLVLGTRNILGYSSSWMEFINRSIH